MLKPTEICFTDYYVTQERHINYSVQVGHTNTEVIYK